MGKTLETRINGHPFTSHPYYPLNHLIILLLKHLLSFPPICLPRLYVDCVILLFCFGLSIFCELVFPLRNFIKLLHQPIVFFFNMPHFFLLFYLYQVLLFCTFFAMIKNIVGKFFLRTSKIASRTNFIDPPEMLVIVFDFLPLLELVLAWLY